MALLDYRARRCLAGLVLCLGFGAGCQRLPEQGGPITSASGGTSSASGDGTFSSTFMPGEETADEGSDDDGPPQAECDPVQQTGCAMGERCTATAVMANEAVFGCVADNGNLEPFEGCEQLGGGADGCPAGYACIADFAGAGLCAPLCQSTADCDMGACSTSTFEFIPYCADNCSPFDSLCAAPTQCRRNGDRFSCRIPSETDVGLAGAPCKQMDDGGCSTGLVCVAGALVPDCTEGNCCAPLCELDAQDGCTSPATCNSALNAPAPGFDNIGACFVPS